MALKFPLKATSSHSLIVWTTGHNQTPEHEFLPHWPQVLFYERCIYLHTAAPGLCPALCCQPARDWATLSVSICEQLTKTDRMEGAMEHHKVLLYSPVMCIPVARETLTCLPQSLSFLAITQFCSWFLKIALVLLTWAYERIKKNILHIITFISRVVFLNPSYFFREREDQVLGMSTNIYRLYQIQSIFTSRGHTLKVSIPAKPLCTWKKETTGILNRMRA